MTPTTVHVRLNPGSQHTTCLIDDVGVLRCCWCRSVGGLDGFGS